jgi:hypothetical protein
MGDILNEGHSSIISKCNVIQVMGNLQKDIHPNYKLASTKHQQVFELLLSYTLPIVSKIMELH